MLNSLLDAQRHEGEKGGGFLSVTSRLARGIDVPELKVAPGEAWTGRSGYRKSVLWLPWRPLPCSYSLSQGGGATATPLTTGRSQEENPGELRPSYSPPLKATDWLLM